MENKSFEKKIFDTLKDVGIPCNLRGYHYIKTGIMIMQEDPDIIQKITKEFYPEVAKIHKTTGTRVERAIRHAIEKAFEDGYQEDVEKIVRRPKNYDYKPTNSEFIAGLYEYLKYND